MPTATLVAAVTTPTAISAASTATQPSQLATATPSGSAKLATPIATPTRPPSPIAPAAGSLVPHAVCTSLAAGWRSADPASATFAPSFTTRPTARAAQPDRPTTAGSTMWDGGAPPWLVQPAPSDQ